MDLSTILVVEKNSVTRRLINQLLTARGFDVLEAGTVQDAAALVELNVPQLAIVDFVNHPAASQQFVRELYAARATPVLALTSSAYTLDIPPLVADGVSAVLVKPFEPEQLFVCAQTAIQLGVRLAQSRTKLIQLETALKGERDTSVAVGLLMERFRLDAQNAFEMLRSYARTRRRRLHDLAAEIVDAANLLNGPRASTSDSVFANDKKG